MDITYSSVANPRYSNADQTMIDCDVVFAHLGSDPVPFSASKYGLAHEQLIFAECRAGMYGPVREYMRDAGRAIIEISRIRDARLAGGYQDTITGKTFECDDRSIGKWTPISASAGIAKLSGQSPEPEFDLITADNSVVTLTATEVFDLFNLRVMPWVSDTILYARTLKDKAIAGTAPADLTKGWP